MTWNIPLFPNIDSWFRLEQLFRIGKRAGQVQDKNSEHRDAEDTERTIEKKVVGVLFHGRES